MLETKAAARGHERSRRCIVIRRDALERRAGRDRAPVEAAVPLKVPAYGGDDAGRALREAGGGRELLDRLESEGAKLFGAEGLSGACGGFAVIEALHVRQLIAQSSPVVRRLSD
jgi:hypothetical protein